MAPGPACFDARQRRRLIPATSAQKGMINAGRLRNPIPARKYASHSGLVRRTAARLRTATNDKTIMISVNFAEPVRLSTSDGRKPSGRVKYMSGRHIKMSCAKMTYPQTSVHMANHLTNWLAGMGGRIIGGPPGIVSDFGPKSRAIPEGGSPWAAPQDRPDWP